MGQGIMNRCSSPQVQPEIRAFAPFREAVVQRMSGGIHAITKWFEELAQSFRPATRANYFHRYFQRQCGIDQFWSLLAVPRQSRTEYTTHRHGEIRRCY